MSLELMHTDASKIMLEKLVGSNAKVDEHYSGCKLLKKTRLKLGIIFVFHPGLPHIQPRAIQTTPKF